MTKKQQQMYWNVTHSNNQSLYDVYSSFSTDKYIAYRRIVGEMATIRGYYFRITSANSFSFSCGFLYYDNAGMLHCRYYTSQNTYDFIVE